MNATFELSNDPFVRANSIHPEPIAWETHVAWFNKSIQDPDTAFFIAETDSGDFAGQIRFNRVDTAWRISISIAKPFRGKGHSKELLRETMTKVAGDVFTAEIALANEPSKRLFLSLGFAENMDKIPLSGFRAYTKITHD